MIQVKKAFSPTTVLLETEKDLHQFKEILAAACNYEASKYSYSGFIRNRGDSELSLLSQRLLAQL